MLLQNHSRKLLLVSLATLLFISFLLVFIDSKTIELGNNQTYKYVVYFDEYNPNTHRHYDNVIKYYDENLNQVYEEKFSSKGLVWSKEMINNKIYSYGYAGIFVTDLDTKITETYNNNDEVTDISSDKEGNVYIYQNIGRESGYTGDYLSRFLRNNEKYLDIDYPLSDFYIEGDKAYFSVITTSFEKSKIIIYEHKEKVREVEFDLSKKGGQIAVYNDAVFLLNDEYALRIDTKEFVKVPYVGIDASEFSIFRPVSNAGKNKLYINSREIKYTDVGLEFGERIGNLEEGYNPNIDKAVKASYNGETNILSIDGKEVTVENNSKYKYNYLEAFMVN